MFTLHTPHAGVDGEAAPRPATPWYRRRAALACAGIVIAGSLALAAPLAAIGVGAGAAGQETVATSIPAVSVQPGTRGASPYGGGSPYGGTSPDGGTTSTTSEASAAGADESTGVVIIETTLGYADSAAAGTGMVLTADGLVLTNTHVIEDSTEITVTIASTGDSYTATVLGTDAEDDVALLQLEGAQGLDTVTIDDDAEAVGDPITAVGNADGGGVLMAADGEITELESSVTTASQGTAAGATLDGMIEIVADVVSGDSGGAVLDAEGEVVGMTTAASSGTATTVAYAIPIEDALAIVDQILAGDESDGVALGYPAFLGVQIAPSYTASSQGIRTGGAAGSSAAGSGATIAGVIEGTPAATGGLVAGDTITAIDGTAVTDAETLSALLAGYDPGDAVTITWVDDTGAAQSATVTLVQGPAA